MKFRFLLLLLVITIITTGVNLPFKAEASSPDDISVATVPSNPVPNQNITIILSSYVDNLNSTLISWSVGGRKISSGIGDKSVSLNAPALGSSTTVIATLSLSDGNLEKTIVIKPSIMTMLWQANNSYVPPFYKGKAMPSPNSEIKVVALPEVKNGSTFVDPKNMTYAWQLDGTNDANNSGYGKNYFVYTSDYLDNSNNASVTATTLNQSYSTDGSIDVTTTNPKIEFYKNDPSMGTLWEQALSDGYHVSGNEIIQAAPYFVSPKDLRIPFLNFAWSINDQQINTPIYSKNLLPISAQTGTSGTAKIDLTVNNIHDLTQTISRELNVNF